METIAATRRIEMLPLTQGQVGIWLTQMLDPDDPCWNIGECIEIRGPLDERLFELALRHVVAATDAMHLRFAETDSGPAQYFSHDPDWELIREDFSRETDPEQTSRDWMMRDMSRTFRLDGDTFFRFALLRISAGCTYWYAVNHHLINDGIGWRLFQRRVGEAYCALPDGKPIPALPDVSWRDLVADEVAYRTSEQFGRDRRYWLEHLANSPAPTTLSGRPPERPAGYSKTTVHVPHAIDLAEVARRHAASPAALIVAATAVYLHRMTGAGDMLLGMPLAARVGAKSRSIVGVAANALPLRIEVSVSDTIGAVIARTARGMRATLRHQRYRGEDLRRDLRLSPNASDICGTYVNFTPFEQGITFGGHPASSNPLGNWRVEDIQFVYYGGADRDGQRIDVIGNPQHYTATELAQHASRFVSVVEQLAAAEADIPVASIDVLTASERKTLHAIWKETGRAILNDRLEPVPFGVIGALHVAVAEPSAGSAGSESVTSESLVADLFGEPQSYVSATGNRASWREDGTIQFHDHSDRRAECRGEAPGKTPEGGADSGLKGTAALRTPTELTLAGIWGEVLRCRVLERTGDFFQLGGDSLRTIQVMIRVKRVFSVDLPLATAFEARTLQAFATCIDQAIGESGKAPPLPALRRAPEGTATPLSFSQQRMWTIQSLDPLNTAYNMSTAARLTGEIDHEALARAIDVLLMRHDILRTTYRSIDGEVLQRVQPFEAGTLQIADLTATESDPEGAALAIANTLACTSIDLENGPIFAIRLMRIGVNEHILHFLVHHIAGDQWSLGVIGRELASIYNALRAGEAVETTADSLGYRDFAAWEREHLGGDEIAGQLEYWHRKLANVPPLDLPIDRTRPRLPTLRGSFVQAEVPDDLFAGLEQLGRRESATLFMSMFAGYAALLARISDQHDIAIGVPVANRSHDAVEQMVGTFVNFLVLRVDVSDDPTFSDLVARVRTLALEAFANQSVPFDRLVQELVPSRNTSRAPLAQVMFNLLNAPLHGLDFDGVSWEPVVLDRGGAQFELSLSVDRQISETATVEYNTDLFEKTTIERFLRRYLQVLSQAVAAPATRVSEFDLLVEDERRLLLGAWNDTAVEKPFRPFIDLLEARAEERPEAPAVTFGELTLSYGELNARANALAHELVERGVGRGGKVGVCVERSPAMVVALLAVQKSGAAYVPLDPALPAERLAYMMTDSDIVVIVMSAQTSGAVAVPKNVLRIDVGSAVKDGGAGRCSAATAPPRAIEPADPVYVIYTSGSTGRPKGVAVPHGALSNFLTSMQRQPGLHEGDVLAAVTTISFDIAGLELYLPLQVGGRVELVAPEIASDGVALARLIAERQVNVMQATPATWRMLLDAGWKGGPGFRALCGGEALPRELAEPISERVGELWNLYGPTETTIWSTAGLVERGDVTVTIGRPIDNTQIYILRGLSPCPIGGVGEICIGGDGVAIGYLGRPDLTAERFVADPFAKRSGARMYRTGDLGKWDPDGRLHHLGRMDHQVKIRGFRVETGEIEAVLNEHPAVRQSIVITREIGPGDVRLIAYILYRGAEELTNSDVRRYLRTRLPEYMIPAIAVPLDAVPLSASGKMDRNALPDPFDRDTVPASGFEAPSAGLEAVIASIWHQLLKVERVGADDNFFELGGDSLLALRFVAGMERQTGTRIDPRSLFFQSLRQVAAAISELSQPKEFSSS
ncbi:MAG: amino acid adenylation domain-containing protein [Hyphomicrobiaceae bacterium]